LKVVRGGAYYCIPEDDIEKFWAVTGPDIDQV
jgi:hypothetical protein